MNCPHCGAASVYTDLCSACLEPLCDGGAVKKLPDARLHLCPKCGCTYIDGCPEHSPELRDNPPVSERVGVRWIDYYDPTSE